MPNRGPNLYGELQKGKKTRAPPPMDASSRPTNPQPCLHHHLHHRHIFLCPRHRPPHHSHHRHHRYHHQQQQQHHHHGQCHRHPNAAFIISPTTTASALNTQNPETVPSVSMPTGFGLAEGGPCPQMLEQLDYEQQEDGLDEGDDYEEPVFVLTDEWREFFAKSEAKRKSEKKQAKKKVNKN